MEEENLQLLFDDGQRGCALILRADRPAAVDEKRERQPENSAI
jgi:hypothetical protein